MSALSLKTNELYATWQFSNNISREIAGLCHEGKILSHLLVGTDTNVEALQKQQEGIPFHTHITSGFISPPSAEDIIQYIYQRLTVMRDFPFIVLAREGCYTVNIDRTQIQIIRNFINLFSCEELERWKCVFIKDVNSQILENLVKIRIWNNYRIKFHNFVIDIKLNRWH